MKPKHPALADVLGHASTDKRIDILRRLGEVGSISEAARRAGISYKAGWQAIETLSNLAGTAMVEKAVGGSGGGGTVLTAAGRRVLDAAARLDQARAEVLAALDSEAHASRDAAHVPDIGLAALALRTSMRNQFPCVVKSLHTSGGLVRVGLELPLGGLLYSRITRESAQLLQLTRGLPLLALCKATAVRVAPQIAAAPACNLLPGSVVRATRSALGGEVALQLDGGVSLVGFSPAGQPFKRGAAALASLEESAVVLAARASL